MASAQSAFYAFSSRFFPCLLLVCLLLVCLLLAGCYESRRPEGVVATVNGEAVSLRSVQALLDSRSAALGTLQRPSLEKLQQSYGEALGSLIMHALVRQELQRLQIPVSDAAVEQAVEAVRQDYGDDGLSRFLSDESLEESEWRALVRDHLAMLSFEKRVLLPSIEVTLPEVRAYYEQHAAAFSLPERYEICFATGRERASLEAYCARFPGGRSSTVEGNPVQCAEVEKDALPVALRKEVAGLKAGTCGTVRREKGLYQVPALVEARPAGRATPAEVYPLIESALVEQKKSEAFERWLESALARADVRVSPHIKEDLLLPPSARPVTAESSGSAGENSPDGDFWDAGPDASENESRSEQTRTVEEKKGPGGTGASRAGAGKRR